MPKMNFIVERSKECNTIVRCPKCFNTEEQGIVNGEPCDICSLTQQYRIMCLAYEKLVINSAKKINARMVEEDKQREQSENKRIPIYVRLPWAARMKNRLLRKLRL